MAKFYFFSLNYLLAKREHKC